MPADPDVTCADAIARVASRDDITRIGLLTVDAAIRARAVTFHQQLVMNKLAGADGIRDLMTTAAEAQDRCRAAVDVVLARMDTQADTEAGTQADTEADTDADTARAQEAPPSDPVRATGGGTSDNLEAPGSATPASTATTSVSRAMHAIGDDDDGEID